MIELCSEYLSLRCIWLYVLVMSHKELLARSRREIWSLSDWNWTRTQNHLGRKRTLNHLAKLAKWLSCVLSTYLYCAFDCMLLSCQEVRVTRFILRGSGLESSCSHLNVTFRACFEQEVPRHSGNYRVWIHSEKRTWYDKNIQSD